MVKMPTPEEFSLTHPQTPKGFDIVGAIMAYENGNQSEEETEELFQYLVDTGIAWTLQGSYGRMARAMIDAGVITE